MSLYDSHNYPPLPTQPEPPLSERVAQAMKMRGTISEVKLSTIIKDIYASARDSGEYSLDVHIPPERTPGLSKIPFIQATVAKHFNLTVVEMISKRRARSVILPRQIAMYLASIVTPHSSGYIGVRFGRDHSTVLHAVEKIGKLIETDASLAEQIETLKGMLA